MQEKELFQHYELKNWEVSPRLYKILAASAIANIFLVVVLAQGNFLTAKSCDTPIVSGVCTVLDTLYVGSMFFDTETGYVNEDYVKTELEDADITFINMDGQTTLPLEYPEGYFAVSNPESVMTDPTMMANEFSATNPMMNYPGIPNNPTLKNSTTDLITKPQVTPRPNKKAYTGKLPTDDNSVVSGKTQNKETKTSQKTSTEKQTSTTTDDSTTSQNTTEQTQKVESEPVKDININGKVLKDFGSVVKTKVDNKEVDLNQPFKVVVEGVLTAEGKFDKNIDNKTKQPKSRFTFEEGNKETVEIAKQALEAIGDSGWLGYLKNLGADKVKITLIQDGEKLFARVESELPNEAQAKSVANGINLVLGIARKTVKGEDETILLKGAQPPTNNGKTFVIDFALPKAEAQAMIDRNLKKIPSPTSTTGGNQSNSTTQTESNQTTGK